MAGEFEYLDQAANGLLVDEGAVDTFSAGRLARNCSSLALDRPLGAGLMAVHKTDNADDEDIPRLGAPWPVAYGPFMLGRRFEGVTEATLVARFSTVEVSIGGTAPAVDTDLVYIYATAWSDSGYELPPSDPTTWENYDAGDTLTRQTTETLVSLTVPMLNKTGWVGVLLWVCSIVTDTAEAEGDLLSNVAGGGVAVDWTTSPPAGAMDVASERVARFYSVTGATKISSTIGGADHYVGYLDDAGPAAGVCDSVVYTAPPWTDAIDDTGVYSTTAGEIHLHTIGIARLSGLWVQDVPTYLGPTWEAFAANTGCRQGAIRQLITEINRLGAVRMPTYRATTLERGYRWWSPDLELTASYQQAYAAWLLATEPADDNGYRCLVGIAGWYDSASSRRTMDIKLQLNNYTPLSTSAGTGTEVEINLVLGERYRGDWKPLAQTIWGVEELGAWSLRGAHVSELVPGVSRDQGSLNQIQWEELYIASGSMAYPAAVKVEAKDVRGLNEGSVVLFGACLQPRGLDET